MAAVEEDILCQEEVLQEEERLQEAKQRRTDRMEKIWEIADLERDRDCLVNRIRRLCSQSITKFNFTRSEDAYISLLNSDSELNLRISVWEDLLDLNEDGTPEYPQQGQPKHRYTPHAEDFSNKTRIMEGVISETKEALKTFFTSLPVANQAIVSQEAMTVLLKNSALWLAGYHNPGQNNNQE